MKLSTNYYLSLSWKVFQTWAPSKYKYRIVLQNSTAAEKKCVSAENLSSAS